MVVKPARWSQFLVNYCDCEILDILSASPSLPHHTLLLDGSLVLDYDLQLCSALLCDPKTQIAALNRAAVAAQRQLLSNTSSSPDTPSLSIKNQVHVRLHNFPHIPELVRNRIPAAADVGKLLILNGTVIRTGNTKVLERVQVWKCFSCHSVVETEGRFELKYKVQAPKKCDVRTCKGFKFKHLQDENMRCSDYQEIRIQEKVERLDMGSIPRAMTVVLEYDLVDTCKAGDDVTIYGVVCQMWDQVVLDVRCSLETVLHANHLQINNEQRCNLEVTDSAISRHYSHWRRYQDRPMVARNLILASFCPDVYQLYIVKLAALLVLLGGVTHVDGRGSKVRGECHMLMVGDPGTGKSQILKYVSKLSPRSVITTGIGCTKAGLTVAAVKEGGEWVLEAGAMVLADGGVCCVDELSSIRETDRVAIHEAMEQQTISVAKAGLVCKLNTRTTVLAATNPRGKYDITQPISANVPIGTPLLSRFDLILVLFDDHTTTWDNLVAGYLLKDQLTLQENDILKNYTADTLWSFEELQQYVAHVKTLTPKLTPSAKEVLGRYYRRQREQISRNVSRTTLRMLESLVRISQAHAKLMMHDQVELDDAIITISLVECTMLNSSLLGSVSVLHSVFPADPQLELQKQRSLVLDVLGLPADYGRSAQNRAPQRKSVAPPNPLIDLSGRDEILEVPPFHWDEQELKKDQNLNQKNKAPLFHNDNQPAANQETTTTSSALSTPQNNVSSFAELVRNFKAKRKPSVQNTETCHNKKLSKKEHVDKVIRDLLEEDFSDILATLPDFRCEIGSASGTTAGESQSVDDDHRTPLCSRQNTPVTKMYSKFDTSPSKDESRTSEPTTSFTPLINTQSNGLVSTGFLPPPAPHFPLSPVPHDTITRDKSRTRDTDSSVTEDELRTKTTKPSSSAAAAEKLKKFSYRSSRPSSKS